MSEVRIECPPKLDRDSGAGLLESVRKQAPGKGTRVMMDFSGTTGMDSLGGAWLVQISAYVEQRQAHLELTGQEGEVAEFLELIHPSLTTHPSPPTRERSLFVQLGGVVIAFFSEFRDFLELCFDAAYWTLVGPLEGRGFRWGLLIEEMNEMGVKAIRIVCLMNFLLGLIIAMLSSAQVESFGLSIYVADLMMIGFARELAAIMTATVVSARTGAAIAAEIATMKVQEEIDALRGMGLNVAQYLVAPKLLSLIIVLPCLVALGLISGLLGGAFWGVFVLEFRPSIWWTQTVNAAVFGDFMQGFLKTFFFAIAIALIGCHNGLRVTGGSRGVGLMTTRAVVMDIFMLICIDIVFAAIFYYIL